jgi:ABC-type multidrug transport system fused ATPase/permease subunit
MEAGQIVETGTHQELILNEGPYARLYKLGQHGDMKSTLLE